MVILWSCDQIWLKPTNSTTETGYNLHGTLRTNYTGSYDVPEAMLSQRLVYAFVVRMQHIRVSHDDSHQRVTLYIIIYYTNIIIYITIIDFNLRVVIYPKKVIHGGHKAEVNITFKGRYILMSMEIEVNNCFVI